MSAHLLETVHLLRGGRTTQIAPRHKTEHQARYLVVRQYSSLDVHSTGLSKMLECSVYGRPRTL